LVNSYIISGTLYRSDVSTVVTSENLTVTNTSTGDSLNGDTYADLKSDSNGEWIVNIKDFTNGYSDGDGISIEAANSSYGKDKVSTSVVVADGGETGLKIVLQSNVHYDADQAIDKLGEVCDYRTVSSTQDTEKLGSISTETTADSTVKGYFKTDEDAYEVEDDGNKRRAEGSFIIRTRDGPAQGNLIRVPRTSGDWYVIEDEPIRRREGAETMFYLLRLVFYAAT